METQKERRLAFRRGQLAGTRYPRQAIRGTGLGRGDPSADGASQCDKKPGVFRVLSQRPKWAHPSAVLIAIEQPYWCRVDRQLLDF